MSLARDHTCMKLPSPDPLPIVTATVSAILSVAATSANGTAIYIFIKHWMKRLNNPFYFHIANLAVADFMVGVVTAPLGVVVHIFESQRRQFSDMKVYIIILHFSFFINSSASVLFVLAMTVDRFMAVRFSLSHRRFLQKRIKWPIAVSIWVTSIGLSLIYFVVGYSKMAFVYINGTAFLTMIFMTVSYFVIFRFFKKRNQEESRKVDPQQIASQLHTKSLKAKTQKTLNILLAMFMSFCVSYIPACLAIYYINFCLPCNCVTHHWLRDFHCLFSLTSSCINPICYIWRLQEFRKFFNIVICNQRKTADISNNNQLPYTSNPVSKNDVNHVTPVLKKYVDVSDSSSGTLSSLFMNRSSSYVNSESSGNKNNFLTVERNGKHSWEKYLCSSSKIGQERENENNPLKRSSFNDQGFNDNLIEQAKTTMPPSTVNAVSDRLCDDTKL